MNKKSEKGHFIIMSISKVDISTMPLLFLFSYSLVPEIVICLKHFLEKKFSKTAIVWPETTPPPLLTSGCLPGPVERTEHILLPASTGGSHAKAHTLVSNG